MNILLITDEEWNDYVYANGVLTNWFTGFKAEFAQIYTSPGLPINEVCDTYFQITDAQMLKSLLGGPKAGGQIEKVKGPTQIASAKTNAQRKGVYGLMKKVSTYCNAPVQFLRDFIWLNGRYDEVALREFVHHFQPDIIFCPRMISPKLMRLESIISRMTKAPFVAFTGDDEASMSNCRRYTLGGVRRWLIHKKFKKHIKIYSHYLMHSAEQAEEYKREYGLSTGTLFKCGQFPSTFTPKPIGRPIRLMYAGRLYCNRWKSLAEIGKALQQINKDGIKMILDVYTQEQMSKEQQNAVSESRYIYMKGCVTSVELKEAYMKADIALHVEAMDHHFRMATRVSFSTKIIDLMASTCAIMAICWEKHCGYQYLKEHDAAICVGDYDHILPTLQSVADNPTMVNDYARKAYLCGKEYHSREKIQSQLMCIFDNQIK